jgi:hypothetical protein
VAPLLVLAGLFAIVSWFGLWRVVGDPLRYAILAAFVLAAVYLVARGPPPCRQAAALHRVEQASGLLTRRRRSATTSPSAAAIHSGAQWLAHREALASIGGSAAACRPSLAARPLAWFLAVLLLVVGFVYAGPERIDKLFEAFAGGEPVAATVARIDAWVTPPAYTSRPPIFLTGDRARPPGSAYSVPVGSVVTVRTGGITTSPSRASARPAGASKRLAGSEAAATLPAGEARRSNARLPREGHRRRRPPRRPPEAMAWRFNVEPDLRPRSISSGRRPRRAAL